ncbi:SusC/RagA family TonB-linked outer membrane protein [Dinghuibacter silviterrae]|uniref:TonB-linked SusC/RagA family outer membrane protein n=1 Tax=Dinghuibacter silviterrae TaxID=1539049 RepID=A0A4V3GM01_9BACT|nr:SusC/RagA family TonB-linked outer membrane protein [Dinghuibacter silviterrae]TDX01563.1 TonB-linked SusC/RagA family outer membrane protein [Dinghuibacter silviterrae]
MQKAAYCARSSRGNRRAMYKILMVMKLTAVLITFTLLQAHASGVAQTITLSGKNLDMKTVFTAIKKQTGYVAFSKKGLLEECSPISFTVRNMPLQDFLALVSQGQPFTYLIVDKTISLSRKEEPVPPAQEDTLHTVSGRIVDENGRPLSGASITIKHTKTATMTQADGSFTVRAREGEILVVTFVGFTPQEVRISATHLRFPFSVRLQQSSSELDQLQVTAYGTTTKRLNPGDITTITAKDIENNPVTNVLAAIQGRVPGLFVQQVSGQPGSAFKLNVRDATNFSSGAIPPLVIVDGVRYPNGTLPVSTNTSISPYNFLQGGSALNFINPNDIASIDVLKDADATAIYGSSGAYGVIIITTKKAKPEAPVFNANVYTGVSVNNTMPKLLNTQQYLMLRQEALKNNNQTPGAGDYDLNGTWSSTAYTDWRKVYLGSSAQSTNANLSYSGGNKNTSYMVNGSYMNNGNIQRHKGSFQNGNIRFSLNTATNDNKFNLNLSGGYLFSKDDMVPYDFSQSTALDAPNAPSPFLSNGNINWADNDPDGPGTAGNINRLYNNQTHNLLANGTLVYRPVTGVTLRTIFGYNDIVGSELSGYPTTTMSPTTTNAAQQTSADFHHYDQKMFSISPYAEYDRNLFQKGDLSVKAGGEIDNGNTLQDDIAGKGFASDALLNDPAAASTVTSGYSQTPYRALGFYGIVKYVWDGKYIVDFNGRRDGSTRFGPDKRFGNFGSVAAAWIFSEENFVKEHLRFISFGKLRASTGVVGGDAIRDYAYLSTYSAGGVAYDGATTLYPSTLANPNLQWEKNRDKEVGLEMGFLKDRVFAEASYYHNESSNQLVSRPVSSVTGFSQYVLNSDAVIRTSGWEMYLNTRNLVTRNFTWSTRINLSIPTSKLLRAPSQANQNTNFVVGKPVTGLLLYKYAGVDPQTGYFMFTNAKGTTQDDLLDLTQADKTQFVDQAPKYYGGIQNTFTYKQFSLDFFLNYTNRRGENALAQSGYLFGMFDINGTKDWLRRWQNPGDKTDMPKVTTNLFDAYFRLQEYMNSTGAYTNASYIRLSNVNLRYQFSKDLVRKMHLRDLSVFFQGQNLLTISHFGGLDPENMNAGVIPPLRVFTGGINLSL